jgi:putative membrane protein
MSPHESTPALTPPNPSRTRDHLANERTFLAWVRTALGLIGLGFVLARMGLFLRQVGRAGGVPAPGHPISPGGEFLAVGIVFLLLGTAVSAWAGWHHRRSSRAIEAGRYEPASLSIHLLTALVVLGGVLIAVLLVTGVAAVAPGDLP